jgi:hypothetical protein
MRVERMTLPGEPAPPPAEEIEMLDQPCIAP